MAKDPAFLFYSSDFMMGTALMSETEVGQYIRVLCHMHQSGHLSMEDMKNICPNISPKVVIKFKVDDDGKYFNPRLEAEVQKRRNYSESRRKNRLKDKNQSYDKTYVPPVNGHMENENENENRHVLEDGLKEGVQGEKNFMLPDVQGDELHFPFDSIAFRESWAKWKEYRLKEHGKDYTAIHSEQAALKLLSTLPELEAIGAIDRAMAANWATLWPDRAGPGRKADASKKTVVSLEELKARRNGHV